MLYGDTLAADLGSLEFKAVREDWLLDPKRTRQDINRHMRRVKRSLVCPSVTRPIGANDVEDLRC
ncbi:MAG: hypothetical protein Aurels2KO_56190 [Aureliella sp.]